jgi:hypothetical protein
MVFRGRISFSGNPYDNAKVEALGYGETPTGGRDRTFTARARPRMTRRRRRRVSASEERATLGLQREPKTLVIARWPGRRLKARVCNIIDHENRLDFRDLTRLDREFFRYMSRLLGRGTGYVEKIVGDSYSLLLIDKPTEIAGTQYRTHPTEDYAPYLVRTVTSVNGIFAPSAVGC